jgi:predicted PurR-regulated permease PerM
VADKGAAQMTEVNGPFRELAPARSRIQPRHYFTIAVLLTFVAVLLAARDELGPYILGGLIAYLLVPIARRIEERLPSKGRLASSRHILAVLLTFFLTLAAFLVLLSVLLRPMLDQTSDLLSALPVYWAELQAKYQTFGDWYVANVPEETRAWINAHIDDVGVAIINGAQSIVDFFFNVGGGIFAATITIFTIPLFMIYFLIDQPRLPERIRHQAPASWGDDAVAVYRIADHILGNYTRGVVLEATIVGVITGIGYWLIGVELALPLGVVAFVGEIVPIAGPWIAFFISFPVVLVTQPDKAIPAVLLFGVIQLLEGWLLTPRIEGSSTDFTSSTTLILLAIGAALGGAFGMLISLPVAAIARTLIQYTSRRLSGFPADAALEGLLPAYRDRAPAETPIAEPAQAPAATPIETVG